MEKWIKTITLVSAAAVIAYAQAADSSVKQGASQTSSGSNVTASSNTSQKYIAHVVPTTKTNWSKVKDLFL
jgi:hypothetical protein